MNRRRSTTPSNTARLFSRSVTVPPPWTAQEGGDDRSSGRAARPGPAVSAGRAVALVVALATMMMVTPAAATPRAATGTCQAVGGGAGPTGGPHRATVVVDTGSGPVWSACVSFSGTISGLVALDGARAQIPGLDPVYEVYAGNGRAVCKLRGTGNEPPDCLSKSAAYWAYFRNGGYSRAGAGTSTVSDGDTEGWRWGTSSSGPRAATDGYRAATAPPPAPTTPRPSPPATRPPVTTLLRPAPVPARPGPATPSRPPSSAASPGTPSAGAAPDLSGPSGPGASSGAVGPTDRSPVPSPHGAGRASSPSDPTRGGTTTTSKATTTNTLKDARSGDQATERRQATTADRGHDDQRGDERSAKTPEPLRQGGNSANGASGAGSVIGFGAALAVLAGAGLFLHRRRRLASRS